MLWALFMCILIEWLVLDFRLQTKQWRGGRITCLASMCLLTLFFSWLLCLQIKQLHPKVVLCMFLPANSSNSSCLISTLKQRDISWHLDNCAWTLLLIRWVFMSGNLVLSQAFLGLIKLIAKLANQRRENGMIWLDVSRNVNFVHACLTTNTADPIVWDWILHHVPRLKIFQIIIGKFKTLTWPKSL